jgi:hypothetical protein
MSAARRQPFRSSAAREAFTLPLLLLGAGLAAAVRVDAAGTVRFAGPTLLSLVLAVMLIGLLFRAGVLAPERLMAAGRSGLANANGAVVLLALLFASAHIFTVLTPESGLMGVLFGAFYLALLWTTAAARPTGIRLIRSLAVVFGTALVLRFIVLNGLSAPEPSLARRVFTGALEGLTLGGLGLEYHAPATGYAAFGALGLFFAAVLLLPHDAGAWRLAGVAPWRAQQLDGAAPRGELSTTTVDE